MSSGRRSQVKGKGPKERAIARLGTNDRSTEASNEIFLSDVMDEGSDVDDDHMLPIIVRNEMLHEAQSHSATNEDPDEPASIVTCRVRDCAHKDMKFSSTAKLLEHHNTFHPDKKWSPSKCAKLGVYYCGKCNKLYFILERCPHAKGEPSATAIYAPIVNWSITVAAVRSDVPVYFLELFEDFLTEVGCTLGIACLERGDKENNLHLQAAAEIAWNPEDVKGLVTVLRTSLQLSSISDLSFKVQVKPFVAGQSWLGMIGYCQKWRDNTEFRLVHRGMSEEDIRKGQLFLQVYRSDYTKDKYVLDVNNIIKASYAYWTATKKPQFATFIENMTNMIQSGDFVLSGKILSSAPLDKARTEESWLTLLMPYVTSEEQINLIVFGSGRSATNLVTESRYALSDFQPSPEDSGLIDYLQQHIVNRRENTVIVGPPGCGKSCLIQALTIKHGVHFFGTADELKEAHAHDQFIVFDDFDFDELSVDDVKRLLDRECLLQRVKVRYHDAVLSNRMTRIVLCNELPEQFHDPAVADRTNVVHVQNPLFPSSKKRKFRGTHLQDNENFYDGNPDQAPTFAWSYASTSKKARQEEELFESRLRGQGAVAQEFEPHAIIGQKQLGELRALVSAASDVA